MADSTPSSPRETCAEYGIVVPLTGPLTGPPFASIDAAIETIRSVREHADRPERLALLGSADDLAAVKAVFPDLTRDARAASERPTLAQAIGLLLDERPTSDLLVVSPGIVLPPLFDLRLHWSARSAPGVVTVSPLCDLDPVTTPSPDRLRQRPIVDAPWFLPECFYLVAAAARAALSPESRHASFDVDPANLSDVVAAFRRHGLIMALAPHLVVESRLTPRNEPWLDDVPARAALRSTPKPADRPRRAGRTERASRPPRASHHPRDADPARARNAEDRPAIERRTRPRVLHVTHSLGGGLGHWLELFHDGAGGDSAPCDTLVLRSIGTRGGFGAQLWLYDDPRATSPLEVWKLEAPIPATATHHLAYREAIDAVVRDYGVSAVVVSSLIGHSLDVFATGLPTALVCHDYYPACPAVHIHFGEVCSSCEPARLVACFAENPLNELFDERDSRQWLALRDRLFEILRGGAVRVVAPSPSVERHYKTIFPDLAAVPFTIVPHGLAPAAAFAPSAPAQPRRTNGKLRLVIPGRLTAVKGADLFRSMLDPLLEIAEIHLVGCGEGWNDLRSRGVDVLPHYEPGRLPEILAAHGPDLALLLSIVPETWSLTLEECLTSRVPVLATRVGSFADRIDDGVDGFLCDPHPRAVLDRLAALAAERASLEAVRARLSARQPRSASEMVADYARLLELPRHSRDSYFAPVTPSRGERLAGARLPPGSPIGFLDFLRQVEAGTYHHLDDTPRLGPWSRRLALAASRSGFRLLRWVAVRW